MNEDGDARRSSPGGPVAGGAAERPDGGGAGVTGPGGATDGATRKRKGEHLRLALDESVQLEHAHFDDYRLRHRALPEIDFGAVDTTTEFLGRELRAPLLISCMTGGAEEAERINRNLAVAAESCGVAMGVGSQRAAVEDPLLERTFEVRERAPSVPVLANLGVVQLNCGYGVEECRRAVEMVDADALVLHLNPLQEAIQPEGDRDFGELLPRIAEVVDGLDVPVAAKEIGCGISGSVARELAEVGVGIVDVAGLGGTSWARIEARRARDAPLGDLFADWGIPTPRAIREAAEVDGLTVIGSGGLRSGLDVAKSLALGADLAGMASPFLEPATESAERVVQTIERIVRELRIAMFCTGSRDTEEMREVELLTRSVR